MAVVRTTIKDKDESQMSHQVSEPAEREACAEAVSLYRKDPAMRQQFREISGRLQQRVAY